MPRSASSPSSGQRAGRKRCTKDGCRKLAPPGRKRCEDHKPGASGNPARRGPAGPKRAPRLLGRTEPRIFTPPLRPLNRRTSRGFEVIDFAEMIGEPLLPWQKWAVIHALELNPDGTFRFRTILILVARQNGKSHLKRVVTLWRMYLDGARDIVGAAQDLSLARKQWLMCQETIHNCPDLETEWVDVRNVNGDEMFWAGTGCYAIKATNDKAGRGGSNDEVNIDELRAQHDWRAWGSLSKTTMARRNGQTWAMSNAGDDGSVVLNQLQAIGEAGTDPSLCLIEYSAPDGCELDGEEAWAQANPGLGYTVSEAAIRSALATDPPNVFRTEVLCQKVDQLEGAVDLARWNSCADAAGTLEAHRKRIAACFDAAPDGKHATLAVAAVLPDGRVRVEIAAAWKNTDAARAELGPLLDRIKPVVTGWYPSGPAAAFAPILRARRGSAELTGGKAAEACMGLADLTRALRVVHPADPLLDAHIRGASKLNSGDGWRFTRRGEGHVDAAYAAAGAVKLAQELPPVTRARIRMIS
ncbi:MAG: hypothetical protein ACRDOL_22665 [Streptosporangiaceae bacterium]